MITAIYERVSTNQQSFESQHKDLERWVKTNEPENPKFYKDKFTGRKASRPAIDKLLKDIKKGSVKTIVVWRLDRLGRNCSGLCQLFDLLKQYDCNLISLKDGIDLSTPTGLLVAQIISSIAQFEIETISQRIKAGQNAARANGKKWGGSKKGWRKKEIAEKVSIIQKLLKQGVSKTEISRSLGISYPTVINICKNAT